MMGLWRVLPISEPTKLASLPRANLISLPTPFRARQVGATRSQSHFFGPKFPVSHGGVGSRAYSWNLFQESAAKRDGIHLSHIFRDGCLRLKVMECHVAAMKCGGHVPSRKFPAARSAGGATDEWDLNGIPRWKSQALPTNVIYLCIYIFMYVCMYVRTYVGMYVCMACM